jgi:hypothetical protein
LQDSIRSKGIDSHKYLTKQETLDTSNSNWTNPRSNESLELRNVVEDSVNTCGIGSTNKQYTKYGEDQTN